jgi:hypothetical protein
MKQPIHSTEIQRTRRCKINSIEQKRWSAYATAVLASGFTLSLAESAEAEIHYSGLIKQDVPNGSCFYSYHYHSGYCYAGTLTLPLGANGNIKLIHSKTRSIYGTESFYLGGSAYLKVSAPGAAVRGGGPISRLLPGNVISAGPFTEGYGLLATYGARGQFQAPGQGFVGFKFNTGAGEQYGWVRVRMNGFPENSFAVVDYAYGDPGEVVKAGQRKSRSSSPHLESLGGLALGAIGLLAWRRRRGHNRTDV